MKSLLQRAKPNEVCIHCGDIADYFRKGVGCECHDCYRELTKGKLPSVERITAGREGLGRATKEDDASPGQQNAIRHLEDG